MRFVTLIARILLGLPFTVFGLNTVLMSVFDKAFMPPPKDMPQASAAFFQTMTNTRFMLPLLGGVQLVSGLMILTGVMTPLGLTLLAPVIVHIVLFHHFVDPNGVSLAYALLAVELFLAFAYGPAFCGVLDPRARARWSRKQAGSS